MTDTDILFITGLFPKEFEEEIIKMSKGNIQNAANVLQWNIVKGLDSNLEQPIKLINSMYIGSFPLKFKKLFIKTREFIQSDNTKATNVGFVNLCLLKHFSRYISLKKHIKTWSKEEKEKKVLMAYALTNVNLWCFKYIKKLNPSIETCIIVPDLPEYMDTTNNQNKIKKLLKKYSVKKIYNDISYVDKCVFLTEQMSEKIPNKPYIVIEGISNIEQMSISFPEKKDSLKTIVYTGTLNERYGITNLLKAFQRIEHKNYRLIICGDGDSKHKVLEAAKLDSRIIYKGLLSRDEVIKIQKKATVLINPRTNDEDFCRYSFPSKIMEYLSSGVPMIGYKLEGIPEEYNSYIFFIEGNTIDDMVRTILKVCEKNQIELDRHAEKSFYYIKNNKNCKVQCKKIIDLINK